MKLKALLYLLFLFVPVLSSGQEISVLPTHLPKYVYGNWVDEKNNIALIITQDYIIVNKELFGYNSIVQLNDKLDFTCVNNSNSVNVKYINITKINASSMLLDEGFRIKQLTKLTSKNLKIIPKSLIDNWYFEKKRVELKGNKVFFLEDSYRVDYVASSDAVNYFIVLYFAGKYNLLYNTKSEIGHYLNTNFFKTIIFKKATFHQKNKALLNTILAMLVLLISYCLIVWRIRITKKREIAKRLFVEMQLKSFRSQMNPHFLFNALSAIQNLINKGDNEKANHYLTEFSQLMRLTLDKTEKGLVPLVDEIESITKYLEIERLRFPFNYKILVDSNINTHEIEIPAMLIQPFVENAIIHGLNEKSGDKKLKVELKVEKERLSCLITDNGIGINNTKHRKNKDISRDKYGLKLAQDRIALINDNYKTNASIKLTDISNIHPNKTGTIVEIMMPLKY